MGLDPGYLLKSFLLYFFQRLVSSAMVYISSTIKTQMYQEFYCFGADWAVRTLLTISAIWGMSGSCHLDRALNVEIGVECLVCYCYFVFNCSQVLQFVAHLRHYKGALTQKR